MIKACILCPLGKYQPLSGQVRVLNGCLRLLNGCLLIACSTAACACLLNGCMCLFAQRLLANPLTSGQTACICCANGRYSAALGQAAGCLGCKAVTYCPYGQPSCDSGKTASTCSKAKANCIGRRRMTAVEEARMHRQVREKCRSPALQLHCHVSRPHTAAPQTY